MAPSATTKQPAITHDSLAAATLLTEILGNVFAKAFALFTVEVLRLLENGDSSLLEALEAAARQRTDGTKPSGVDSPSDGESGEDLSSAADWIKEAYQQAKGNVTPLDTDPVDRRARLMRDRLALSLKRRDMTQSALAKQLGKTPSQISRIFANPQRSRLSTLAGIADALEVDLSDLLREPGRDERTP